MNSNAEVQNQVRLEVRNLSYGVMRNNKEWLELLQDISFYLESGDMCAIMGPSGKYNLLLFGILYLI